MGQKASLESSSEATLATIRRDDDRIPLMPSRAALLAEIAFSQGRKADGIRLVELATHFADLVYADRDSYLSAAICAIDGVETGKNGDHGVV